MFFLTLILKVLELLAQLCKHITSIVAFQSMRLIFRIMGAGCPILIYPGAGSWVVWKDTYGVSRGQLQDKDYQ